MRRAVFAAIAASLGVTAATAQVINGTGIAAGSLSGLGAGVATFLGTPSSANLASAVTDETGTGALVFGTSPTLTDPIIGTFKVSTSPISFTNNASLALVPGLTFSLAAGKTYNCQGHLTVTASGASGGIQVKMVTPDTLTQTASSFTGTNWNGTTMNIKNTVTAIGNAIGSATAVTTDVDIVGAIVVNAAGTFNVGAAQNVSNATTTTIGQGSTFSCVRVN